MKRIIIALALAAPLAGCGPDCDRFCRHWVTECGLQGRGDVGACVQGCGEVGSDYAAFISCALDKSCQDLRAGHCQITSVPPGTP